jgi:hypothetical protein
LTDTLLALDGRPVADTPNTYRVARAQPKPPRRNRNKEAETRRLRELERQGYTARVGKTGASVFDFGTARPELKARGVCNYCCGPLNRQRSGKKFCSDKCRVYASRCTKRNNSEQERPCLNHYTSAR